jgi:predicted secreted protein
LKPISIAAIYILFWTMSLFLVLPFGVRTDEEAGAERSPGHAESSPHGFRFGRAALRATVLATLLFALFYANWTFGWLDIEMLDWAAPPTADEL